MASGEILVGHYKKGGWSLEQASVQFEESLDNAFSHMTKL